MAISDLIKFEDLKIDNNIPLIDTRTSSEYKSGHIAGAVNIPLFTDTEREEIGKLYKQVSQQAAIDKGLEVVGPKMASVVQQVRDLGKKEVVIYCWRGGMRSKSMCWLLNMSGIKCQRIENGYKAYRGYIRKCLGEIEKIIILGGYTGSGKTDILLLLKNFGVQILDLEGLANHKGSAFGHINEDIQPTTEQFENNLYDKFRILDPSKPVVVENESRSIGKVNLPDPFFLKMRKAPVLVIELPKGARVKRLVNLYTDTDKEIIISAVEAISKKLGGDNLKKVISYIENDKFNEACEILLTYYDGFYQYGMEKRDKDTIHTVKILGEDMDQDVEKVHSGIIKIGDI